MSGKKLRWIFTGIIIATLLLGVAFVAWKIIFKPAPVLGPVLPDYPAAIFHKTDNITYPRNGYQLSEIYIECGSALFGAEDYRGYSTDDKLEDILSFYREILAKNSFDDHEYLSKNFLLGKYNENVTVPLTNKITCFHKGSSVREYPGYALLFLDPQVPAEAAVIKKYLPDIRTTKLVFFVMRGFITYG